MNPDLLRTEFLGVTVRYDDVELPREDLAAFFASVSDSYGLPRFEYHDDGGATLSSTEGSELVIRPGHAACGGVTRLGFAEGLERLDGLLGEAISRYGIGPMWLDDVTLVATWDLEDEEAGRRLLMEDVLRFDEERLAPLEGEDLSLGLRIWRGLGDGTVDCSLEPMHADPSRIYIRLVYSQREQTADLGQVLGAVEAVHGFLQGPVKSFVLSLARR
ncbi:MAG TPA: hypothetical protein VKD47_06740 [Miltoncostaeaceae bacterium]|nr:hypothetical protein [Miltoncostaeaceae bacterium]